MITEDEEETIGTNQAEKVRKKQERDRSGAEILADKRRL